MRTPLSTSVPKNQFKCFHCRLNTLRREGKWVNWKEMQVHLCPACDLLTRKNIERAPSGSDTIQYSGK